MERFATQHTCFVSGLVTIVIFLSFNMQTSGGCGNWNPHTPMALCAETCFFQISIVQEASGRGGGGGAKKKMKNSLASTPDFFFFFAPPPRPAGRHSWSHTLRPCPLSSTPRTSCESLVHLDLCSISHTNLKSFQTGKRRNFKFLSGGP